MDAGLQSRSRSMTAHKIADLGGALLDAAVARAEGRGLTFDFRGAPARCFVDGRVFAPSTDWSQGGPIIERERIAIVFHLGEDCWDAYHDGSYTGPDGQVDCDYSHDAEGPTPLIAAMRAYVASKLGDTVELP